MDEWNRRHDAGSEFVFGLVALGAFLVIVTFIGLANALTRLSSSKSERHYDQASFGL